VDGTPSARGDSVQWLLVLRRGISALCVQDLTMATGILSFFFFLLNCDHCCLNFSPMERREGSQGSGLAVSVF